MCLSWVTLTDRNKTWVHFVLLVLKAVPVIAGTEASLDVLVERSL